MKQIQKKESLNIIPVVFATNEKYAPYAAVAITSLVKNSSKDFFYDIYVFYTELSENILKRFALMKGDNYTVTCLDVNTYIDKELDLYENFHFSKEMYYRILIPTILNDYEKVIYLDCDLIVLKDISELYNIDLEGNVLGGVNDIMHYVSKTYVSQTIKLNPNRYINSGMLVIDCNKFKQEKIKEKCFSILKESDVRFRYPDQDIINIACENKIMFLDSAWNFIWHYNFPVYNKTANLLLSEEDEKKYQEKKENINILHFTSNIKPWNNYNTIYTKYFFNYVEITSEFKDIIYDRYNKIGMKNYVVFQFFDDFKDKIVLTGAFYSIENYLYKNSIIMEINGHKQPLSYISTRNIDLRNLCYAQNFFKVEIPVEKLKEPLQIRFYRKSRPTEKLPILTGRDFPFDKQLGTRAYFLGKQMFIEDNQLIIKPYTRNERIKNELYVSSRLNTKFGKLGKKSAFVRFVYYITKPFYKKDIWLLSDRTNVAGDNGEAFFKYLIQNKPKNTKVYFVLDKKSKDYCRIKKYGKVLQPKSIKFDLNYIHATKNISSQFDIELCRPFNEIYIKDLTFNRENVFLQHGITKDDISLAYSRFAQNIRFFITSSNAERQSIVNNFNYGLSEESILLTGFPRYDYLKNKPEKIIYLLPTWRKNLLEEVKSNNYEELRETDYYKFYNDLLHNQELEALLTKYGYKLIAVPHELAKGIFKDFDIKSNNIEIQTNNISYNEIFNKGSLLITDYSSTAFDFAYLKKPLIYCQFDKDTIYNNHTYKKGYFDYERDAFGKVTYDLEGTLKEIEKVLKSNCRMTNNYISRVENFFAFNDTNNSSRVLSEITRYDREKCSLLQRTQKCYRENGFKYTIKRIFAKIIGR